MKKQLALISLTTLFYCNSFAQIKYPESVMNDQKDTYFGMEIRDPYRWLEDDNSAATKKWVVEQNEVTQDYLKQIPFRDSVKARMDKLWNFPRYKPTFRAGTQFFYFRNNGLQNQDVLFYKKGIDYVGMLFLDPNTVDSNGTVSISDVKGSKDGAFISFLVSRAGSDWQQIRVKEVKKARTLADSIQWVKFTSVGWKNAGFFYSCYDAPVAGSELTSKNEFQKVYYHRIGTNQSADQLIYQDKSKPQKTYGVTTSGDEKYLIITGSESTSGNDVIIKNLDSTDAKFVTIIKGFDYDNEVIDIIDNKMFVKTTDGASNGRLVLIDVNNPDKKLWQTIIPESKDALQSITIAGSKIIANYMHNASSMLKGYTMQGKFVYDIKLPGYCTVDAIEGNKADSIFYFSLSSFTTPPTIYLCFTQTGHIQIDGYDPTTKMDFKKADFETKQVFYTSKDGTKIPMFIVHKKGIVLDGNNPTLLFGYGGFNISKTPEFKQERLVFLEQGGVFAMPCIRGGGEYGDNWHKAGTKLKKQNVFDDFIAAAEYLIANKYTNSSKLAIGGRSNGGLLVGACMTQRPDLFKVAIPTVGVLDMLRYQKFTIGWAWATDYGTSDNEAEFEALYKYSPIHNVKKNTAYPATLITTGDHDDRVVPAHSFKFAATLQADNIGANPTLIRIDTDAGHGSGKPTTKLIAEQADIFSFIMYNLGMTWK